MKILMPLPRTDFDPTESAIPWRVLKNKGFEIIFATPDGQQAKCDQRMLRGTGLFIWKPLLMADKNGVQAYSEMEQSAEFQNPISWEEIKSVEYRGLLLPGGHAAGIKEYLDSKLLQKIVADFFEENKVVGAICHGVVLASRAKQVNGQSVLHGRKTTALLKSQELLAWAMTVLWLGNYYRTYPEITVQREVTQSLMSDHDFITGPAPLARDSESNLSFGFCVRDGQYISARWPGDAHVFANELAKTLVK